MSSPAPLEASNSVQEAVMNVKELSEPESKPEEQQRSNNSTSDVPEYTEPGGDDNAERRSVHSQAPHEQEEATPAVSAGVGEPGIPTGDERPAKAAYPVAKAEGETTTMPNNPEPTAPVPAPVPDPDLADATGKQSRRSTMRFLPKGRPNRPTSGRKKQGGGGGCIIF